MSITMRSLTPDDFPDFYELYGIEHREAFGGFTMTEAEVRAEWEMPNFEIATDLMGIFADARLIAYAEVRYWRTPPVRPVVYGYVHPDYRDQGHGTRLIAWAIERAREFFAQVPPEARVVLQAFAQRPDSQQLIESFDFSKTRESWMMQIDFTAPPPKPALPDGLRLVTMADGATVEDIARVHRETFRDHRGWQDEPLANGIARWEKIIGSIAEFDPALFGIVKEGETDVAVITVEPASGDDLNKGVVGVLGVMPAYRQRGIGYQLLLFAFDALYQRGKAACELNVDASSLTGATRLYERAGMRKTRVFHAYELELRAGVEYSNQG